MTQAAFNQIVEDCLDQIRGVLIQKSAEYARGGDRLHNFRRASGMLGISKERALLGFMTKHTVSVLDIVDDLDTGKLPTQELLDEKIGDSLNYLILLKACIQERLSPTKDLEEVLEETGTVH